MRFAKRGAHLAAFLWVASHSVFAQEEFMDPTMPPPATDGLFEDDLEPLQPEVPPPSVQPPPVVEEVIPSDDRDQFEREREAQRESEPSPTQRSSGSFPSPRALATPKGRSLPPLPYGGKLPNENEKLRMDFVQVEIEEIVKYFAERLQRRFIYDPTILSGKITIISPTEVTVREAWAAFLSALEVRGYIVYPAGEFLKLEKAANARKAPVPVIQGETPNDDAFVTRIVNLKYLNVNDIRQAVRNLLSRTAGDVIEHSPTNTLIISDYAFNIRRIVRILNILDVEGFQEQIAVLPLKHASATEIARKVTEFFPAGGAAGRMRTRSVGVDPSGGAGLVGGSALQGSVIQKIVPDERTNTLIVLGSDRGIEQVKKFVEQLDVPVEGGGGQIHVYYLQNVKAEDISQTLAALTSGQKSGRAGAQSPTTMSPTGPIPSAAGPTTATLLNGDVKITADVPTNALVIQASLRDFEVLKSIIQKLDIRRRQVFIESAILEAKVGRGSEFGTQASGPFAKTGLLNKAASGDDAKVDSAGIFSVGQLGQSLDALLQNPAQLTGLALGFRSGGTYSMDVTDKDGNTTTRQIPLLSAVLRLAATSENFNILSTPHILATANEEANISIGEEIPVINQAIANESGSVTRNFQRIRVATELNITPQINADNYLTLKIKQKVNSIGSISADGQPNTINREATTTAIVKDQQTVVIGGLMEDRKQVTENKIPFLGDIPILGWLFKSRITKNAKVNFLLFLTPHIIRDTADLNDQFFRKLKEREKFLKGIGMKEVDGLTVGGLTDEQLKLLDKEYVKSLRVMKLDPLPQSLPQVKEESVPVETNMDVPSNEKAPSASEQKLKVIEPIQEPVPQPKAEEPKVVEPAPLAPPPSLDQPLEDSPPEGETPRLEPQKS